MLPHGKTKPFTLRRPKWNEKAFWSMTKQLGIASYSEPGNKRRGWERILRAK